MSEVIQTSARAYPFHCDEKRTELSDDDVIVGEPPIEDDDCAMITQNLIQDKPQVKRRSKLGKALEIQDPPRNGCASDHSSASASGEEGEGNSAATMIQLLELNGVFEANEQSQNDKHTTCDADNPPTNRTNTEEQTPIRKIRYFPRNAEMERRRIIKMMSQRHSDVQVRKWLPLPEQKWMEELSEKQRESLKGYEERRRQRSEGTEKRVSDEAQQCDGSNQGQIEVLPKLGSDVIEEPVVNSKDAISKWEQRLTSKAEKERQEEQVLGVGLAKRWRNEKEKKINSTSSTEETSPSFEPDKSSIEPDNLSMSRVRVISSRSFREGFIDEEIREAAEREEKWKMEKTGFNSSSSSEPIITEEQDKSPEPPAEPKENYTETETPIALPIITQEQYNENQIILDDASVTSSQQSSSISSNSASSENNAQDDVVNGSENQPRASAEPSETEVDGIAQNGDVFVTTSMTQSDDVQVSQAGTSPRYNDPTLLMSPKGWDGVSPTVKPVSPTFFRAKKSVESSTSEEVVSHPGDNVAVKLNLPDQQTTVDGLKSNDGSSQGHHQSPPNHPPRSGPSFEITSSKYQPETIMKMEMKEAEEREEEWRLREMEVLHIDPQSPTSPFISHNPVPQHYKESRSEAQQKTTEEVHQKLLDDAQEKSQDEMHQMFSKEAQKESPDEIHQLSSDDAQEESQGEMHQMSPDETQKNSPDETHQLSSDDAQEESQGEMHQMSPDETQKNSPDEMHQLSLDEAQKNSPDEMHQLSLDEAQKESPDEIHQLSSDDAQEESPDETHQMFSDEAQEESPDEKHQMFSDEAQEKSPDEAQQKYPDEARQNSLDAVITQEGFSDQESKPSAKSNSRENITDVDGCYSIQIGTSEDAPVVRMRSSSTAEYRKNTVVRANRISRHKSMLTRRWEAGEFLNNQD